MFENKELKALIYIAQQKKCSYVKIIKENIQGTKFEIMNGEENNIIISDRTYFCAFVEYEGRIGYARTEWLDDLELLIDNAIKNAIYLEGYDLRMNKCKYFYNSDKTEMGRKTIESKIIYTKKFEEIIKENDVKGLDILVSKYNMRKKNIHIMDSSGNEINQCYETEYIISNIVLNSNSKCFPTAICFANNQNHIMQYCINNAIKKAQLMVNAVSPETKRYKVIITNENMTKLLRRISFLFLADKVDSGLSILKMESYRIGSELLTIIDDPHIKANRRDVDEEGIYTYKKILVDKGKLMSLLYNKKRAKKYNKKATGNAFRTSNGLDVEIYPTNMYIAKGIMQFEDMVKSSKEVVLITEISGLNSGINITTGNFSLPAKGIIIKSDKIIPIDNFVMSGNIFDLFKLIIGVGKDMYFDIPDVSMFGSPSIMFNKLLIVGGRE